MAILKVVCAPERFRVVIADGVLYYWAEESFWFFLIQHASFVILTIYLIRIPSICLAILFREVPFKTSASIAEMVELVAKWERHYYLICDIIADVNRFIGGPLFIFITHAFLTFISYSFYLLKGITNPGSIPFYLYYDLFYCVIQFFICMIVLAFVSETIPKQVRY